MKIIAEKTYYLEDHYDINSSIPIEHDSIDELKIEYKRLYAIAEENAKHNKKEMVEYQRQLDICNQSDSFKKYKEKSREYLDMVKSRTNYNSEKLKEIVADEKKFLHEYVVLRDSIQRIDHKPTSFKISGINCNLRHSESIEFYTVDEWFKEFKR